jgi:TPR repeat protein
VAVGFSISIKERQLIRAQDDHSGSLAEDKVSSQPTETSRTARLFEGETSATLLAEGTSSQASPSAQTVRVLSSEEIKLLTKQGEQFAAAGDFVTARLLFQRAAEADDATAVTALGATYDPRVLAKLGVVGIGADVEKARFWYQKAAALGSSDAKRRLSLLANR